MNALYANARGAPPIHKQHIIHNIALCSFLFYVHDILLYGKVTYHPPPGGRIRKQPFPEKYERNFTKNKKHKCGQRYNLKLNTYNTLEKRSVTYTLYMFSSRCHHVNRCVLTTRMKKTPEKFCRGVKTVRICSTFTIKYNATVLKLYLTYYVTIPFL